MKLPKFPRPAKQTKRSLIAKALCLALMIVSVVFDQLTKKAVVENMYLYQDIPVIKGIFHWKYIHNTGAAFGMLKDQRIVFLVLSTVTIIGLLIYLIWTNSQRMWWMTAIGMLAGGGIGNMIDRVAQGYVVDFISAEFINFPVFNVADCFVCIGVGLMMFLLIRDMIAETRAEKAKREASQESNGDTDA